MKKTTYVYSVLGIFAAGVLVMAYFSSANAWAESRLKNMAETYYTAMMEGRYEDALEQLYMYDEHYTDGPTELTKQEAKEQFLQKTAVLEEQGVAIKDVTLGEIEYEDGHSFWLHVQLVLEKDGQLMEWQDIVYEHEGKLIVSGDDPFVDYRNGKMDHLR
ncbi:MAG: hypothetical protein ACI33P_04950 [Lysinibacillus sp.]